MVKYNCSGSIILIASMSGSITNRVCIYCLTLTLRILGFIFLSSTLRTTHGFRTTLVNLPYCRWPVVWHVSSDPKPFASTPLVQDTFIPSTLSVPCVLPEITDVPSRMTAAYLDKQPHLLEKWSSMNPMGRLGRSDELRGTITWLASDASSFCTGSE